MSQTKKETTPVETNKVDVQVDSDSFNFPQEEEIIMKFWEEKEAFKTQLKLSENRPKFTFYDGPPFATGMPHYGHILAGTIKDTVTRYVIHFYFISILSQSHSKSF